MSEELQEDLPKVIEELEKKCKEHPKSVMAWHHLGLVYMKAGRIDDAIASLEKAIEIDDLNSDSMINLGAIYFAQGELKKTQILVLSGSSKMNLIKLLLLMRGLSSVIPNLQLRG